MSNIRTKIGKGILTAFLPVIGEIIKSELKQVEENINEKDPEHLKVTLQSIYPPLKQLQKMAESTETEIDDTAIGSLVGAIEEFCKENSIDLPETN